MTIFNINEMENGMETKNWSNFFLFCFGLSEKLLPNDQMWKKVARNFLCVCVCVGLMIDSSQKKTTTNTISMIYCHTKSAIAKSIII